MRAWIVSGCGARGWTLSEGEEVSLWAAVVSVFVAGAAVGSIAASKIADRIGRKGTLLVTQILAALACALFITCYAAAYVEILLLGRLVAGLSAGLSTVIVSLYLSEVCPSALKGVFSAIVPLGFTVGMLIAYLAGLPQVLGGPNSWPFLLGMPVVYVMLGLVMLPFSPESPSYCYTVLHDETRALAALKRLRRQSPESVEEEMTVLRGALQQVYQGGSWSLRLVWQDQRLRKLLVFVFLLNVGQQLSGINAVFYYSTLVFRSAGLDDFQSAVATLFTFIANVIMSVTALSLLRYCKRRVLLSVSLVGILACHVALVAALSVVVNRSTVLPSTTPLSSTVLPTTILPPSFVLPLCSSSRNLSHGMPSECLPTSMPEYLNTNPSNVGNLSRSPASFKSDLKAISARSKDDANKTSSQSQDSSLPHQDPPTDGSATAAGVVAMAAMILFVFMYGGGLGPIPYCYAAETFPCGPRGLAVAVGGVANWGGNFAVGLCFPLVQRHLKHYSFLVFAACSLLLLVLAIWQLPEPPRETPCPQRYDVVDSPAEGSEETSRLSESPQP